MSCCSCMASAISLSWRARRSTSAATFCCINLRPSHVVITCDGSCGVAAPDMYRSKSSARILNDSAFKFSMNATAQHCNVAHNSQTTVIANNNNNNNNSKKMFMVLLSRQSDCESSPGSFNERRTAPSGRRPKTKPDDLGCESACTGCQKLHSPSPFIITQPES